jgi:hypothetical protein
MCLDIDRLLSRFRPKALAIPHPEEPRDPLATAENTILAAILAKWFADWEVPGEYQEYWRGCPVILVPNLSYMGQPYPALAWNGRIEIDPTWCNPGILAHENCHIVWAESQEDERVLFSATYRLALETDPLLKFVYSQKPYMQDRFGKDLDVEGHAECYRYLGQQMPAILKPYYPRLF